MGSGAWRSGNLCNIVLRSLEADDEIWIGLIAHKEVMV
jgi:hypothetical protein